MIIIVELGRKKKSNIIKSYTRLKIKHWLS